MLRRVTAPLLTFLLLATCAYSADQSNVVQVQMRNLLYRVTDRASISVARLDGELRPTSEATIPSFDDKKSFAITIRSAEISISADALTTILNQQVFAAPDAPLRDIQIRAHGTGVKITGKMHSKGDVPFETDGSLSATPQGEVRIHSEHVKAAHLPVKGLMDLLGVRIADLIKTDKIHGLRIEGDDLILNPTAILPPPRIEGRISAIAVRGNQIVQTFGGKPPDTHGRTGNYMSYQGGQLKFGKLTMSPTDLVLIDPDPRDPFDFSFTHYKDQLVAGYTKNTPQDGLRVYMPDYGKLKKQRAGSHRAASPH
jgi:hypothetical protein